MKIVSLTAENYKRLKAVYIEPDGTLQVITGKNAAGKTSVMDAVWAALGGGAAARDTTKPVRDGEDEALVELDLGDIVVTRTWKGDKTALTVKSADGAKFPSPQNMLDALLGKFAFDPLAFTRLSDRDQVSALLDLVKLDIDLNKMAAERSAHYEQRAEVGRQAKAYGDVPKIDKNLPTEEVSASVLIGKIREAQELERDRQESDRAINTASEKVTAIKAQIKELEADLKNWTSTFETRTAARAALPPVPDVTALEADLEGVEAKNAAIRANNTAREESAAVKALDDKYEAHTKSIEALDAKKSAALAKAKFPVDGLGFTEEGVTFQGVPFSQASSAEQIKVSLAMAMALNPRLRVIRILDGSLLDTDSMKVIADMAAEHDFQVLVERVEDGSGVGILIEDGEVSA